MLLHILSDEYYPVKHIVTNKHHSLTTDIKKATVCIVFLNSNHSYDTIKKILLINKKCLVIVNDPLCKIKSERIQIFNPRLYDDCITMFSWNSIAFPVKHIRVMSRVPKTMNTLKEAKFIEESLKLFIGNNVFKTKQSSYCINKLAVHIFCKFSNKISASIIVDHGEFFEEYYELILNDGKSVVLGPGETMLSGYWNRFADSLYKFLN